MMCLSLFSTMAVFMYVASRIKSKFWKISTSIFITIFVLLLLAAYVVCIFIRPICLSIELLIIIAGICACLYKIRDISWMSLLIGAIILIGLIIYAYYYGSVVGYITYRIDDFGGLKIKGNYQFYRTVTFLGDFCLPFTAIFNILVYPFWLRDRDS